MGDEEIVKLFWARSERAVTEAAKKHGRYCRSIALNILQSPEDAEECVNDTWLNAWESMPPHRPSCLSTFLGKIVRNLALNRYKHLHAAKRGAGQAAYALEELGECASARNELEGFEDREAVTAALDKFLGALSKRDRMVFLRRYWYFSPVAEIARDYGLSQSNVKMILSRGRGKLKAALEQEGVSL